MPFIAFLACLAMVYIANAHKGERMMREIQVLDREVDEVRLPGVLGEMGVLPGHTPLLTSLAIGPLTLFHGGTTERLVIAGLATDYCVLATALDARARDYPTTVLAAAIRDDNPVVFLEGELMYAWKGEVPAGEYLVPIGKADIVFHDPAFGRLEGDQPRRPP